MEIKRAMVEILPRTIAIELVELWTNIERCLL